MKKQVEIKCKEQTVNHVGDIEETYTHAGVVLWPGVVVEIAAAQHVVVHVSGIVQRLLRRAQRGDSESQVRPRRLHPLSALLFFSVHPPPARQVPAQTLALPRLTPDSHCAFKTIALVRRLSTLLNSRFTIR